MRGNARFMWRRTAVVFLICISMAGAAYAQTTTATLRGKISDEQGNAYPTAEIIATATGSGYTHRAVAGPDGRYLLGGLTPGAYRIEVQAPAYRATTRDLTLLVGQTLDVDFRLRPEAVLTEEVTVIGSAPVEMETSEVTTNVTREQINNLPQGNRNFMNFAALAPGVTVSDDEFRKTFQSGAQRADAVNVFVDGVSFKNDILAGGVVGQDASRGNPFPQNAVQEFRVLTQNYSAEYQKASAAVITAVTRSGSNEFTGDVFGFFQDSALVDDHPLSGAEQPFFERLQTGLSIGGPIMRDRMHFFVSYEGNDQNREEIVRLGGASVPAALRSQVLRYEGNFPSDFQSDLLFGKVSFQPADAHLFEFSGFMRDETDVRNFGNDISFEAAEQIDNDVMQGGLRHQYMGGSWLNEANVSYQTYTWNPQPANSDLVGRNYFGLIRVGGRETEQDFDQKRLSLRDDFTFAPMTFRGSHAVKAGVILEQSEYSVVKRQAGNPIYNFRSEENWEIPFEAIYGLGDPEISADNTAFGIYVQDDWGITDRLTANLGLRWDYESDMFPQDWVTPADAVAKFSTWVDADRYFTDGNDREPINDMFAPRLGLTYDLLGNSRTILFGGWGRYYDRIAFNNTLDERFRLQYKVGNFQFSRDGAPRGDGRPTVAWDPAYMTEAGLQQLLATGRTGNPELFLIENDTQPPYSDQATIGVRQSFGAFVGSLSYGRTRSYNGMTFTWGHLNADGTCCRWGEIGPLGYAAILTSNDDIRTWYDAIYLTLEKPFNSSSRWGGSLAYTHADAESIGGDLFSLDYPTVGDYPRRPILGTQEHRLVANTVVRLPFNFNFGTIVNYGSGYPFDIIDRSAGTGPDERIRRGEGTGPSYLTFDLRLEYELPIRNFGIGLIAEAFNVTNDAVYNSFNGDIFTRPDVNPNFGKPTAIVAGSQRRFQYGVRVRF
jgi:hypothetical protein